MTDRIEKTVEIKAPIARVWKALTDHREFGTWFRVRLEGPFVPGKPAGGQITYPGYEHVRMEVVVQKMQPERLFSFTWHPNAVDPRRLFAGAVDAGRVHARADRERNAATRRRERIRQDPRATGATKPSA